MSDGQRLAGFSLTVGGLNLDLSTFGRDTCRCIDTNHFVADNLEVSHLDIAREFYLGNVSETRTIDGHRLVGDNLRGEERLDAQSHVGRILVVFRAGCKSGTDENHGQQRAQIINDMFHNS